MQHWRRHCRRRDHTRCPTVHYETLPTDPLCAPLTMNCYLTPASEVLQPNTDPHKPTCFQVTSGPLTSISITQSGTSKLQNVTVSLARQQFLLKLEKTAITTSPPFQASRNITYFFVLDLLSVFLPILCLHDACQFFLQISPISFILKDAGTNCTKFSDIQP